MTMKELRTQQPAELERVLRKTREELRAVRFRLRAGQEKDVRLVRELRARVARLLTALGERAAAGTKQ
jgi:ribosomal protein L29